MIKWNKRLALGLVAAPVMILGAAALPALAAGTASAPAAATQSDAYGPGYGYGMGPGMMGGYGPGYAGGAWQRGAVGPHARGWARGGYGSYGGFGPGMMGGFGAYGGWGVNPKLTDAQRTKVVSIEKALFDKQWPLMQSMQKVMFEAWGQAAGDKFDVDAIMKRATALSDLRLQMLRNRLEAVRQMDAVLTPQQRESLGEAR
jgi:Spy/CpxP family protein refolding chaperone